MLSTDDTLLADRLLAYLKSRTGPRSSTEIIFEAEKSGIILSTRQIQKIVHYLRAERGELIGSTSAIPMGYWLCQDGAEYEKACAHLRSRAREDWLAYSIPLKRWKDSQTLPMEFEGDPIVEALEREFQTVRI